MKDVLENIGDVDSLLDRAFESLPEIDRLTLIDSILTQCLESPFVQQLVVVV